MKHNDLSGEKELALIHLAAQGEHKAFQRIVEIYEPRLLAYLIQMLGDSENARDIAQETFVAIFHSLPRWQAPVPSKEQYDISHPLAPLLYRIATNRALSLLRKQIVRERVHVRRPDAPLSHPSYEDHEHMPPAQQYTTSFEDSYIARDMLCEALRHLSEEDAACLVLHFVNGERYGEIAARLGLTSEAVRKRVHRALVALRKAYATLDMEAPYERK